MEHNREPNWEMVRQADLHSNHEDVETWLHKMPVPRPWRDSTDSFTHDSSPRLSFRVVAILLLAVISTGFIPVADLDRVGTIVYWESPLSSKASLQELGLSWVPESRIVSEAYPNENVTKRAALLPANSTESQVEYQNEWDSIGNMTAVKVIHLEEPLKRTLYEAFFSSLPASLRNSFGMYTQVSADFTRFMNLARVETNALFSDRNIAHSLSGGFNSEGVWFQLTPTLADGYLLTPRELKLEELMRTQDAINLLTSEAPAVLDARAKLTDHYNKLAAELGL